ncbi:Xaa-Pro peptidase family protein [Aliikangiella sp. G2MR2-5]|uniref:M24 family metallopeptidase n=1 Tax=Aliikangiella sp. G2MR2-5 TaxID=2788943 RepID=UPI0018AB2CBD|nr:Xaa-Pro peptidase family protein [Aliikangiella sp. G2MR2-5]
MTIGVGGFEPSQVLASLTDMTADVQPIALSEYQQRINNAVDLMNRNQIDVVYLNAGTNLYYFSGTRWYASERMVGALLTKDGQLHYIAPHFEIDTLKGFMKISGDIHGWHEDESPYELTASLLREIAPETATFAIDESSSFFIFDGLRKACTAVQFVDAKPVTAGCRSQKSETELELLQIAKNMTLEVHKAAAKILRPGISTQEVEDFINQAHQKVGASGSYFCIVLFGGDTAFPHGVSNPKELEQNDLVLIDTGCQIEGYNSDITRTYVFGEPTQRHREIWQIEKEAQAAAFAAAQPGTPCGDVDTAARSYLESKGFGPGYQVPGLPHRTGHGIGLDIHEWPYLVKNDRTPLASGMCFSNEPMMVLPGEFGVRLEDHFYMTETGPKWFTEPSYSIDDPFGYEA